MGVDQLLKRIGVIAILVLCANLEVLATCFYPLPEAKGLKPNKIYTYRLNLPPSWELLTYCVRDGFIGWSGAVNSTYFSSTTGNADIELEIEELGGPAGSWSTHARDGGGYVASGTLKLDDDLPQVLSDVCLSLRKIVLHELGHAFGLKNVTSLSMGHPS